MRQNATTHLRRSRLTARHALVAAGLVLVAACSSVDQAEDRQPLPALNNPPVSATLPGKPIWMDLYTQDPQAAEAFYGRVFGWTLHAVTDEYLEFRSGNQPVAGLFTLSADGVPHYSGFSSGWVVSLSRSLPADPASLGPDALSGILELPDRGRGLSLRMPQGATFSLLSSASGDPADQQNPTPYVWSSLELVAADHDRAARYLTGLFAYGREDWTMDNGITTTVMIRSDGQPALTIRGPLPDKPGSHFVPVVSIQQDAASDADHTAFIGTVQAAGGAVIRPTERGVPGWQTTLFVDPLGNVFGVEG